MSRISKDLISVLGKSHQVALEGNEANLVYGWKDMTADLTSASGGVNNPPTWKTFRDGISAWAFGPTVLDQMWVTFHPNHDVIEGEDFFFHVHWSPNTTDTGVVRWGFEYMIAKGFDQEAFPASTTIYVEQEVATNSQYRHLIAEAETGIPMPEVDSLIMVRLFRDGTHANDTFTGDAFGLTADIHYKSGKFATIGKRPDFNMPD